MEPIWKPAPATVEAATITRFARYLTGRTGVEFGGYRDLWEFSERRLPEFWAAVWDFFDVQADGTPGTVLAGDAMPGAT
ncbi:hypothetical protein AB0J72_43160 [Dactylosporangium sp. NPDC049742]|uniref:hypothetical protein n=1 Tax=Dactylosporangium sp. NPDC049742 TaxID=3154737 RepID=UPI00341E739A